MERVPQRLSVRSLGQDDGTRLAILEVTLNDGWRAGRSADDSPAGFYGARAI